MHSPSSTEIRLERLLALIERLQAEAENFFDQPEQEQLWCNRGYANGMMVALQMLGYGDALAGRVSADATDLLVGCELLSSGRAYLHGQEMGGQEAYEGTAKHSLTARWRRCQRAQHAGPGSGRRGVNAAFSSACAVPSSP